MASLVDGMDALTTAAAPPFVCGITREMPEKPVELEDCGHVFDQDALRRWRAASASADTTHLSSPRLRDVSLAAIRKSSSSDAGRGISCP